MGRRAPYVRDRGVASPPPGYRPGRKAAWLHPRPIHPRPEVPDMPFSLSVLPFDQSTPGLINPPGLGPLFATIAAGSHAEISIEILTDCDQPAFADIGLSTDGSSDFTPLGRWQLTAQAASFAQTAAPAQGNDSLGNIYLRSLARSAQALAPLGLYIGVYGEALDPTTFSAQLVLKTYS